MGGTEAQILTPTPQNLWALFGGGGGGLGGTGGPPGWGAGYPNIHQGSGGWNNGGTQFSSIPRNFATFRNFPQFPAIFLTCPSHVPVGAVNGVPYPCAQLCRVMGLNVLSTLEDD